ncbi:hypothetical protein SH467x_002507 [Pirellulaceae bacterium SH467]|jgi:hypothetical protein
MPALQFLQTPIAIWKPLVHVDVRLGGLEVLGKPSVALEQQEKENPVQPLTLARHVHLLRDMS